MFRRLTLSACLGATLILLSPSVVRAETPSSEGVARAETLYRVGPEDVLRVRVARHEELGGDVVVLQDGRVVLPVVGPLAVAGMTVEQIRDRVAQGLRKKLVRPEVSVEVTRPRPQRIFVSGAVKAPQPLDMKEGWRITEALANAGGLLVRPEVARGTLFRLPAETIMLDLAGIYVDQNAAANLRLQPGDVIDIQEHPTVRIYVTGHVEKPGMVDLNRGRGVVEALALAGGPLSTAALSKSYVVKSHGQKIPVDLSYLINQGLQPETGRSGEGPTGRSGDGATGRQGTTGRASDGSAEAVNSYRATQGTAEDTSGRRGDGATGGESQDPSLPLPGRPPRNPLSPARPVAGGPVAGGLTLEAGDQLVVPENLTKIAVLGMVKQPHSFPMRDGQAMTVADAISGAGGFEKRAQKSKIGIIRMVDGKQTVTTVDMNRLMKGKETNPVLQDRDIVFVPENRKPDWFGRILPGVQALTGAWWYVTGR